MAGICPTFFKRDILRFGRKVSILAIDSGDNSSNYSAAAMIFSSRNSSEEEKNIRQPTAAGTFYPGSEKELSEKIEGFLSGVAGLKTKGHPRIMIVPHAGYDYSGQVAACAYRQLEGREYETVVLIGPSHRDYFRGISVFPKGYYRTPLGDVGIDSALANRIISKNPELFSFRKEAHSEEHGLEVQIPFLQEVLGNFKIVPIIMGDSSDNDCLFLAETLAEIMSDKVLVIASSDLSHYPSREIAEYADRKVIDALLSGKAEKLDEAVSGLEAEGLEGLQTCACGEGAIRAAMILAEKVGAKDVCLLKYANSGDTGGDRSRVVGYASVVFSEAEDVRKNRCLSEKEREELLSIARQSIEARLKGKRLPVPEAGSENLREIRGAFVTLKNGGELRGCIGLIESKVSLARTVAEMAAAAATEDDRFVPVSSDELEDIEIEISALSPLRKIKNPDEIELGKHGVLVRKGRRGGVFLPQVAEEAGWNLEEFMGNLCAHKAALPADCWKTGEADVYVFTAEVFSERGIEG